MSFFFIGVGDPVGDPGLVFKETRSNKIQLPFTPVVTPVVTHNYTHPDVCARTTPDGVRCLSVAYTTLDVSRSDGGP